MENEISNCINVFVFDSFEQMENNNGSSFKITDDSQLKQLLDICKLNHSVVEIHY